MRSTRALQVWALCFGATLSSGCDVVRQGEPAAGVAPTDTVHVVAEATIQPGVPWFRVGISGALLGDTIVLADNSRYRLVVADLRGRIIGEIGGKGAGPGEFLSIGIITAAAPGSVYVHDDALQRGTTFDLNTHQVLGTESIVSGPGDPPLIVLGRLADGSVVLRDMIHLTSDLRGVQQEELHLLVQRAGARKPLLSTKDSEWFGGLTGSRNRNGVPTRGRSTLLFGRETYVLVTPAAVVVATAHDGFVRWYAADGTLRQEQQVLVPTRVATRAERALLVEQLTANIGEPDIRRNVIAAFERQPRHHRTLPPFGTSRRRGNAIVRAGSTEAVWLRAYSIGNASQWLRVTPERGMDQVLVLPNGHDLIVAADERFVTLSRDSMDRELVRIWKRAPK